MTTNSSCLKWPLHYSGKTQFFKLLIYHENDVLIHKLDFDLKYFKILIDSVKGQELTCSWSSPTTLILENSNQVFKSLQFVSWILCNRSLELQIFIVIKIRRLVILVEKFSYFSDIFYGMLEYAFLISQKLFLCTLLICIYLDSSSNHFCPIMIDPKDILHAAINVFFTYASAFDTYTAH